MIKIKGLEPSINHSLLTATFLSMVTKVPVELSFLSLILFDGAPQLIINLREQLLLSDLIIKVSLQFHHVLPHQLQHFLLCKQNTELYNQVLSAKTTHSLIISKNNS